jgi:outer membrane protein assembly factor BamB
MLIGMNGHEIRLWKDVQGFPNKMFPGGMLMGSRGVRNPKWGLQDQIDLIQVDWDGNVVWEFNQAEFIEDPGEKPQWMARQHHDFQRDGNTVGYYAPGMEPRIDGGNTLVLCHRDAHVPYISDKPLLDDVVYEVNWEGEIVWEWQCSDHVEEMGFNEVSRNALCRDPNYRGGTLMEDAPGVGDWMHVNSMSVLGPNKWYDAGDERFHPDNIIIDGRETNIILIISKETGKIVWQVGPYYTADRPEHKLGWIIGQHHAHMIPRGLPGEGNILVFDNGGWAGYDVPNPGSKDGTKAAKRDHSRVLEFDPTTLEIVWQYTPKEAGFLIPMDACRFYSPFISSAQRLPNGNTFITEGSDGRLLEVTPDHEIVWEYISPYKHAMGGKMNMVYRAYRAPYEWVPQLPKPVETPIKPLNVHEFRVPGAAALGFQSEVAIEGGIEGFNEAATCIAATDE